MLSFFVLFFPHEDIHFKAGVKVFVKVGGIRKRLLQGVIAPTWSNGL